MVNPVTFEITINSVQGIIAITAPVVVIGVAWGAIRNDVSHIDRTLHDEIKPDLKNLRERFAVVETKVDVLWKYSSAPISSPRQLNERGHRVLAESGIDKIIDARKDMIIQEIKSKSPNNPYDAEKFIMGWMDKEFVNKFPETERQIKDGAFRTGEDELMVLFVGGIYLRNMIFPLLGFSLTDLGKKTISS